MENNAEEWKGFTKEQQDEIIRIVNQDRAIRDNKEYLEKLHDKNVIFKYKRDLAGTVFDWLMVIGAFITMSLVFGFLIAAVWVY